MSLTFMHFKLVNLLRIISKQLFWEENQMLQLVITLLVLALIAAVLGFGGIAASFAGIAQILFYIFLVLFIISALAAALRGRTPI